MAATPKITEPPARPAESTEMAVTRLALPPQTTPFTPPIPEVSCGMSVYCPYMYYLAYSLSSLAGSHPLEHWPCVAAEPSFSSSSNPDDDAVENLPTGLGIQTQCFPPEYWSVFPLESEYGSLRGVMATANEGGRSTEAFPGTACLKGWTAACTTTIWDRSSGSGSGSAHAYPQVWCCPPGGWSCASETVFGEQFVPERLCRSLLTAATEIWMSYDPAFTSGDIEAYTWKASITAEPPEHGANVYHKVFPLVANGFADAAVERRSVSILDSLVPPGEYWEGLSILGLFLFVLLGCGFLVLRGRRQVLAARRLKDCESHHATKAASQCDNYDVDGSPHFSITSQADIDAQTWENCGNRTILPSFDVYNATGNLTFNTLQAASDISVYDSPWLESLDFPLLERLDLGIYVSQAPSLTRLWMPKLVDHEADDTYSPYSSVKIEGAPALTQLDTGNITQIGLGLVGVSRKTFSMDHVTSAFELYTDASISLGSLDTVVHMSLAMPDTSGISLRNLISATGMQYVDASGYVTANQEGYTLDQYLVVKNCTSPRGTLVDNLGMSAIKSIGQYATIDSSYNILFDFSHLESVGNTLTITNTNNSEFTFLHLQDVQDLFMVDNFNTTIPVFPSLETATNIHLRGHIDTSSGSNIFPALISARGNVTIEAWNDFNCSMLRAQQAQGIIPNLVCHGLDNTTSTAGTTTNTTETTGTDTEIPPASAQSSSPTISHGAWIGIGLSIGIVVIGTILGVVWLVRHFRKQLRELHEKINEQSSPPPLITDNDGVVPDRRNPGGEQRNELSTSSPKPYEASGQAILRETQGNPRYEMLVEPSEMPDSSLRDQLVVSPLDADFPGHGDASVGELFAPRCTESQ
ncbi:hypothetical protein F4778DRAFT_784382 [Xylariomycetidae sp. FL2044]|nr:hypothetical protein F4778DRAFT_784382 [Xylariomycetidae sp. FL2044]